MLVVLFLIAVMVAVIVPNFRNAIISDPLKLAARQTIALVNEARLRALDSESGCFLTVRFAERQFELTCPESPHRDEEESGFAEEDEGNSPAVSITLTEPATIESVWNHRAERVALGEASLWISPDGLMEPSIINLGDGSEQIGLTISPFLPEISMADRALEPATAGGG
jgi:hypothetical protein